MISQPNAECRHGEGLLELPAVIIGKHTISDGEAAGGLKGTCKTCPFNTDLVHEAEVLHNLGCLPDTADILQMKRETGHNWACHSDETKVCAGLCHSAKPNGLVLSTGGLIRPSIWTLDGQAAAVAEASAQGRLVP